MERKQLRLQRELPKEKKPLPKKEPKEQKRGVAVIDFSIDQEDQVWILWGDK